MQEAENGAISPPNHVFEDLHHPRERRAGRFAGVQWFTADHFEVLGHDQQEKFWVVQDVEIVARRVGTGQGGEMLVDGFVEEGQGARFVLVLA